MQEKAIGKIQHPFLIKTLSKLKIRKKILLSFTNQMVYIITLE